MKFSLVSTLVVGLAAVAECSIWGGNAVYNKWHETELERWLDDYNIPHPKAADRKDLEDLVSKHWNDKVVTPYNTWDPRSLSNYLIIRGHEAKKGTEDDVKLLVEQVKVYWTETEDSANNAYSNIKDWFFDTWTDSQLKAFADKHGIPVPQPRKRDSLLKAVRENFHSAAEKISETAQYPGDWVYESWSDSDLKAWFDERGYKVPQPSTRDVLIAQLRRNSRLASENAQSASASASSAAAAATDGLTDALLNAWSDSQIKEWADKNGIKVPQGSKRNELLALARKHRAQLASANVVKSASSASKKIAENIGAATTKAGNEYAEATNGFAGYTDWVKSQIGIATDEVKASASLVSASAEKSLSSAAASASSVASSLSKKASGASGAAAKSASSAASVASKSAASLASAVSASASSASSAAYASASSAASAASASAASASSSASSLSKKASGVSGAAAKSASSAASEASKSAASLASAASASASAASSAASASAKSATNAVKEEL